MSFKRRNYFNNALFQMKFVLAFVIVAFTGNILAVTIFNYLALKKLDDLMWSTHIRVNSTSEIIGPLFTQVNIVAFTFMCITLIIIGIMINKKISGPLYRMSKDLLKVAGGDLTVDIALRQKDEFKDVAHELDLSVQSLRERFITLNEKHGELTGSIEELRDNIRDEKSGADKLASVLKNIDVLADEIHKFKLNRNHQ